MSAPVNKPGAAPRAASRTRHGELKRTSLFLASQQRARLYAHAEETGLPVAEIVRRAIDAYLSPRKKI